MTLILCSECKGKLSDKALICPHCGFRMQKNLGNKSLTQKPRTMHQEIIDKSNVPLAQVKSGFTKESTLK